MRRVYELLIEPSPKRVRAMVDETVVADSVGPRLLLEAGRLPVYYFPSSDVRMDLLQPGVSEHVAGKGQVQHWTLSAGERRIENAAWSLTEPVAALAELRDHVAFHWDRLDRWYEEDEQLFGHPRDPYHRLDVRQSLRRVEVVLGGTIVARSRRALFLFETGLPTRYYLPRAHVRMELLQPSPTTTLCAYKGKAYYWSAWMDGRLYPDIAWSYPEPLPEQPRLRGRICFYNERVDEIRVEGIPSSML